ncbi:hypothetical protein ACFFGH_28190 [Lysobacter korlensis]|uniref:Uncharacterized protein n=1 Tax=Lysobacter korlensis TaxID=553636 RepID=A0ABV6RYP4_9GAMM
MAFTPSLPRTLSLRERVLQSLAAYLPERPIQRPELSPEQRTHRIAMERLMLERSSSAVSASPWPR